MKREYFLEGLNCANCAAKIEAELKKDSHFNDAQLNFVNKKLSLLVAANDQTDYKDYVQMKVDAIENGVTVTSNTRKEKQPHSHGHHQDHDHGHNNTKKTITTLVIGSIFVGLSFLPGLSSTFETILLIIGYLFIGHEVIINSIKNIAHGEIFDENFLVAIATIGAMIIGEFLEGIAVILLFQIGELLQGAAVNNSRKKLTEVLNIKPEFANIQTEKGLETVNPSDVTIGSTIVVKPMEKVPLDGVVINGNSFVDTASLTGESVPRKTSEGDEILSGCINGSGTLFVRVTKTYENSTVAKVLDMVENATNRKSTTENFITKFAKIYTPIVVLIAVLLAVLPPIITGSFDFIPWIYKACGFLVVSCPCALVISIPLGFFGGIGCASSHGILVKGSNYLEALNDVDTAVFDKTGTLTKGQFTVNKIVPTDQLISEFNLTKKDAKEFLLKNAALVESFSTHPIAKSIVAAYKNDLDTTSVSNYEEIPGHGIKALIGDHTILAGNPALLINDNIPVTPIDTLGTVTYLAIDNIFAGYIIISDIIKEDAKTAVSTLAHNSIKSVMLTGDTKTAADKVAAQIGIHNVYSELLPTDKVEKVEDLLKVSTSNNKKVLFVGDGINDAPVLARADIGIAMGGVGSDAAVEAADIVIMTDEPSKIPCAISIAKNTRKIVKENIVFSLGVKTFIMILLAVGYGSMWLAVFADVGVSLIAIVNSIRALKFKPKF